MVIWWQLDIGYLVLINVVIVCYMYKKSIAIRLILSTLRVDGMGCYITLSGCCIETWRSKRQRSGSEIAGGTGVGDS